MLTFAFEYSKLMDSNGREIPVKELEQRLALKHQFNLLNLRGRDSNPNEVARIYN